MHKIFQSAFEINGHFNRLHTFIWMDLTRIERDREQEESATGAAAAPTTTTKAGKK